MVIADGLLAVSTRKWGWVHAALPEKQKPRVCLLMRQTNERPRDKMLRDLVLPLELLACLGTTAHLLLPTGVLHASWAAPSPHQLCPSGYTNSFKCLNPTRD